MSWDRTHRRHQLTHAVLDGIALSGEPVIPARLRAEIDAEFGDFSEFLRYVQHRWNRAFEARLDALLENHPPDMKAALIDLWEGLAEAMPTARLLLDAHDGHAALAVLNSHHRRMLHAATGVQLDTIRLDTIRATDQPPEPRPCRRFRRFFVAHPLGGT